MHPVFHLGPVELPAFFTFLTVAMGASILVAWHKGRQTGTDPDRILDLGLLLAATGVVGCRILHVIADGYFWDYVHLCTDPLQVQGFRLPSGKACASAAECALLALGDLCHPDAGTCHPGRDCLRVFKIWYGGLSYYGGILLALPIGIVYARRHRMGVLRMVDLGGFSLPLGLFFGRLGCWFAGCCFGATSHASLAVTYGPGTPAFEAQRKAGQLAADAITTLPVVPTQLISSGYALVIFAICRFIVYPRRRFHGETFWWFLLLYGASRFCVEFFRADDRGLWFGELASTSQLLAIPLVAIALIMMVVGRKRWPLSRYPMSAPPGEWI